LIPLDGPRRAPGPLPLEGCYLAPLSDSHEQGAGAEENARPTPGNRHRAPGADSGQGRLRDLTKFGSTPMTRRSWQGDSIRLSITMNRELYSSAKGFMREGYTQN